MKRIVFKQPDGGVSITIPCEPMLKEETEKQYLARIEAKLREKCPDVNGNLRPAIPDDYVRVADLPEENIPTDREFRNAWTWTKPKIDIDIVKAREIKKDSLRLERKPLLEELDIEYLKALEQKLDTQKIMEEKQRLRDITDLCDEAKTVEELKAIRIDKVANGKT